MYFYDDEEDEEKLNLNSDLGDVDDDDVNPDDDDDDDDDDAQEPNEDSNPDDSNNSEDNNNQNDNNHRREKKEKNNENDDPQKQDSQNQNGQDAQNKGTEGKNGGNSDSSLDPDKVRNDMNELGNKPAEGGTPGSQSPTGATSGANTSAGATGTGTSGTGAAGTGAGATGAGATGAGATGTGAGATATGAAGAGATGTGAAAATGTGAAAATGTGAAAAGAGAAGGAAAGAGAAATAATPVGWVLLIIAAIILIIIIAVGILMFFVAMPGQIVAKVKNLASNVVKAWTAMIEGEDKQVTTAQLADVANFIEKMGYDLKGEGFVTYDKKEADIDETVKNIKSLKEYDDSSDLAQMSDEELKSLLIIDPNDQGVIRRSDTNAVVDLNSESILSYIISDNQCYIIKNFNTNMDEMTDGNGKTFGDIILGIAAGIGALIVGIVVVFTPVGWIGALVAGCVAAAGVAGGSYLAVKMNSNPDYGRGLISIYHEGSNIGIRGDYYKQSEKGSIALDANTKKLYIQKGWSNGMYSFDVDGWSGRYGMPLEFLLSVHLATQMPELAVEMATSFQTDVEVLLHNVQGQVIAGVLKEGHSPSSDDDFITYAIISEIGKEERNLLEAAWEGIKDFGNWIAGVFTGEKPWTDEELEELAFNDRAMNNLFEKGLPHSVNCTCCSHISGSDGFDDEECSADDDVFDDKGNTTNDHTLCQACQDRVWAFVAALKVTSDKKAESYTPYISKVTDHWFRDVYFVMNSAEDEFKDVVKVDEEYFYETDERWTMYEVWEEGDSIPEGFTVGDYKLYEEGSSTPSTKTKAEVQEINEKIAQGDTSLTRLVKKAVTQTLTPNNGNDWSAYELTGNGLDEAKWEKISVSQDTKNELKNDYVYKNESSENPEEILIYYKDIRPDDIKQVEDGQRTETNSKIKDMFLNKKYYKYDGSVDRANAIIADKSREDNKVENYNTDNDARDKKLIAKADVNKDSLGAFSILENTHTLDADYIYRDFKELIVELNYFDKEDLSDKIQEVMQWVIPECGSAGWPIRKYEKGETFYGTLINSKVDIQLMKNIDIEAAKKLLEELEEEVESGDETPAAGSSVVPSGSVTSLVQTGYDVHKEMEGNGWDYCVLRPDDGCNHVNGNACGLDSTIQEAIAGHHNTCCATFVSWVLKEAGFDLSGHPNMHGAQATYNWCEASGWTPITDYSALEPGDLLFNNGSDVSDIGHVQMLGNNGEWLNAGSVNAIDKAPYAYQADFIIGMRSNMNGAAKEFEGYEPEQTVVAPVTGKVIEYGTVERENVETGEKENVGFIKIQALDHYITSDKGKNVDKNCTNEDCEFDMENGNKKEGYDYFYEEYKGVIESCVLYMEGFELTLDETLANTDLESTDVTQYKPNEVYNMTNNVKEAQSLWKEDAKTAALPYFKDGEDIYIKEGTVVGKTYKDSEITDDTESSTGNGNYIRLILRDIEDSIMEDVETYFDIDKSGIVSQSQPYQAQEGDLELLAALICHEGGAPYWMNCHSFAEDRAMAAAEAVGYVCINRALTNYGGHGTTIRDQIMAPGQYADCEILESYDYCEKCLEAAEWCLTYDCTSIVNPEGEAMSRDVQGQSGWDQCKTKGGCWWWIDTTGDGARTEYDGSKWDTFFCHNGSDS